MKIVNLLIGTLIACACTCIGAWLYVQFVVGMNLFSNYFFLISNGFGGKIIAIGSLLNIPAVYLLMNNHKYDIGKGVILGLILLVVVSQIV